MTGYRYAPVRVRQLPTRLFLCVWHSGPEAGGGTDGGADRHPRLSPDKEAVHRFAEWCGREQLDPAHLPEAIRAAFPDTVKTP